MKAPDILTAALGHMQDRAATYDKPEGERSMPATVAAFNAITGLGITAEQGWLFAVLLKAVRSQQGGYRADNYEDGAAYFALMGEQAAADRTEPIDPNRSRGYGPCDEDGWRNWNGKLAIPHGRVEVRNRQGAILKGEGTGFDWTVSDAHPTQWDIVEWRWAPTV